MSKAVVVWQPPPQVTEARERDRRMTDARDAEASARLAIAKARETQAKIVETGADLVLEQLRKWLRMSQHEDFANAVGPIEPPVVLKLAEIVFKEHRLDTGQSTENVAVAVRGSIDFSKLTQEERDAWRELAKKGGGEE